MLVDLWVSFSPPSVNTFLVLTWTRQRHPRLNAPSSTYVPPPHAPRTSKQSDRNYTTQLRSHFLLHQRSRRRTSFRSSLNFLQFESPSAPHGQSTGTICRTMWSRSTAPPSTPSSCRTCSMQPLFRGIELKEKKTKVR